MEWPDWEDWFDYLCLPKPPKLEPIPRVLSAAEAIKVRNPGAAERVAGRVCLHVMGDERCKCT